MGMSRSEAWAEFLPLWQSLIDESRTPGTVILVEGSRDAKSLHRLGVRGLVVRLHRGQSMSRLASDLAERGRRIILLTDWDSEGGQLARRIRGHLEAGGTEIDLEYRRRLARVLRGEVVHVEGLAGWARRTAEKEGASLDEWVASF